MYRGSALFVYMADSTNSTPKRHKPHAKASKWKKAFIAALREWGVVRYACEQAGIDRTTAYKAREEDPDFALQWKQALDDAIDEIEREAIRRAREGVERTVFFKDQQIGTERSYSDSLTMFLLRSHRPEVYRETVRAEHTGAGGGPIKTEDVNQLSDAERLALLVATFDAARARVGGQDTDSQPAGEVPGPAQ